MAIHTAADVFAPRLPILVKVVQARIARSQALWDLPNRCLRLLQIIPTYTPLNALDAPVVFNRQTPATTLGVSIRTIDRYLNVLVERGLIERVKQKRRGPGNWDCTSIRWSRDCIDNLFSPVKAQPGDAPSARSTRKVPLSPIPVQRPAKASLSVVIEDGVHAESSEQPEVSVSPSMDTMSTPTSVSVDRATEMAHKTEASSKEEVVNKPLSGNFSETPEEQELRRLMPRIPADLRQPALELRLCRVQITVLMKYCRDAKQRLQDVLAVTFESLRKSRLTGRAAMGWLLRVIQSGQDFQWLAKRKEVELRTEQRQDKRAALLTQIEAALSGHSIALPTGVIVVETAGGISMLVDSVTGARSSMPVGHLSRALAVSHPLWIKTLLRGQVPPVAKAQQPLLVTQPLVEAIPAPAGNVVVARAALADARALLRRACGARF